MKSRWALRFVLFVGAAGTAVVMVLRTPWAGQQLCSTAGGLLGRVLGEPVVLDRCEVEPLSTTLTIDGVRVGAGPEPLFTAKRLVLDLAPLALGRAVAIDRLEVDEPRVHLQIPPGDPNAPKKGGNDCLAILDRVHVGALRIRDAGGVVTLPDGSRIEVGELDLEADRAHRRYGAGLHLGGASFTSGTTRVPLDSLDAKLGLDPHLSRLELQSLQLVGAGANVTIRGAIANLCSPKLDLQTSATVDVATAAKLFGPGLENPHGTLALGARIGGPAQTPLVDLQLGVRELAFGQFDLGTVDLKARYADKRVELGELIWPVGEGRAIVRGEVTLENEFPAKVEVKTEGLEFQRLLAKLPIKNTPVKMAIDSVHRLEGHLLGGVLLEGESSLALREFSVRNAPWHAEKGRVIVEIPGTATLDTRVRLTASDISLEGARAAFGNGTNLQFAARLAFNEQEGLHIRARSPLFDIAHIRSHVAGIPLAGRGTIDAVIAGPYPTPLIEGDVDFEGAKLFSAQLGHLRSHVVSRPSDGQLDFLGVEGVGGTTAYDAEAKLILGGDPFVDATMSVHEGGRLRDLFGATSELVTPLAWLHETLDGTIASAHAKVSGTLPNIAAEGTIDARGVRFLDRPFDTLHAKLTVPDITELRFDEVEATRGPGKATAVGALRFPQGATPAVDATLAARGLPLRDLLGSFGEWAELEGGVGAAGTIRGPIDAPDIRGEVYADDTAAMGVALGPSRLSLETQGDEVVVRGPVLGVGALSGSVGLRRNIPFGATLGLDVADVSHYLPKDTKVNGSLRGTATAQGFLTSISDAKGSVELERLALALGDYRLDSDGPVKLSYAGASFELQSVRFRGENTELSLSGSRSAAGNLDLKALGTFDARIVDSLLPQVEHTTGLVELQAAINGNAQKPVLVGSAQIARGSFRVKALPISVQRLNGSVAFSQNQVVVEDATLLVNQGRSRVRGTVSLKDWAPDKFDLVLQGERVNWRKPVDWPAVVSGKLHLGGAWPDGLQLSGELDVDRLRYTRDLELEKAILDFRQRVSQPPGPDDVERIHLDIDLVGGPDMRVDNNLVRARLAFVAPPGGAKPRLKLVGTNVRLGLLGSVEILDGIGFFRGNEYRITHGVVELTERTRIDPEFDLSAETDVREYRVGVHAYGRLDDGKGGSGFQLELGSEPTLAQADIITLLTFGITSKDLDRGGNAITGAGVAAEALLTVSGLDEHVKRWLPDSQLLLDPEFSVSSQYSEVTGQVEPMATFEAKLLTEGLRLRAAAPFSSPRGRRASAEYRVNETVSSQLIWENEETGYSAGDLGMDIKLRWEWE